MSSKEIHSDLHILKHFTFCSWPITLCLQLTYVLILRLPVAIVELDRIIRDDMQYVSLPVFDPPIQKALIEHVTGSVLASQVHS